ncbi:MAG: diguanylate cyclase [Thermoanaerobaculia bacterium]|jgi:diguanylate cyclase (GGDEF)-like protein/PAS domain S-box-containing protein
MSPDHDEAEVLFRAMFHGAADAIIVVEEGGTIVIANEACSRLLGYSPEELEGKPVELLVPGRADGHARLRDGFIDNPRPRLMGQGLLLQAVHADGHEIAVDIALTPLTIGGKKWTACALRDLRGRVHGGEMLRVQATALRSAANGIVITDRNGWITWVNPAACAITGYEPDELIGSHTRILKSGRHDAEFYANIWRTISRGETWSGTIVNRRKDGTLYHEEQTIAPVVNETGTVTHFIAIKQDVTARRRNEEALTTAHSKLGEYVIEIESLNRRLREEALHDPLTGLHNRRFFEEAAARDVARALRRGEPLSVAMIDIDHFKAINDTHGHAVGDLVLRQVATILRAGVRASDLLCRFGGEEFVAVLSGASLEHALEIAEQWRASIAASRIDAGAGATIGCTISVGVAQLAGDQADTVDLVLQRADGALYEAKHRGRDRVVSAEPAPPAP